MFVIEGADHLGKTTFANQLIAQAAKDGKYPIRYAHMTRPNSAFNFREDYLDMISKFAVQDRFHLGALVYHDPPALADDQKLIVERWLDDVSSVVVVLYTTDEVWFEKSLREHGKEEMFDVETILRANRKFRDIARNNPQYCGWNVGSGIYPDLKVVRTFLYMWYKRLDANPVIRMRNTK